VHPGLHRSADQGLAVLDLDSFFMRLKRNFVRGHNSHPYPSCIGFVEKKALFRRGNGPQLLEHQEKNRRQHGYFKKILEKSMSKTISL
jgi:hypothetical protein